MENVIKRDDKDGRGGTTGVGCWREGRQEFGFRQGQVKILSDIDTECGS